MTNENGVKCYKSVSCILAVSIIAFIFGAIIFDLVWTKPSVKEDISKINSELTVINEHINKIDSLQMETNHKFIQVLERKEAVINPAE